MWLKDDVWYIISAIFVDIVGDMDAYCKKLYQDNLYW